MSLSFPANPSVGSTSVQNGRTYVWSGYVWNLAPTVAESYSLPAATNSTLGAVIVGTGLSVTSSGTLTLSPHTHAASDITSGTIASARLGSGTASNTTFLRGDGTWASAGSTSATDLTSGTLSEARLSFVPLHPFLLMGG